MGGLLQNSVKKLHDSQVAGNAKYLMINTFITMPGYA